MSTNDNSNNHIEIERKCNGSGGGGPQSLLSPTQSGSYRRRSNNNNNNKRKADSLGRMIANTNSTASTKGGRGALVGWTLCPLCGRHSQKKFALGRGIAAHLHAVHTPWAPPGRAERRKRRRLAERARSEKRRKKQKQQQSDKDKNQTEEEEQYGHDDDGITNQSSTTPNIIKEDDEAFSSEGWEPTEEERKAWDEKVLAIVKQSEDEYSAEQAAANNIPNDSKGDKRDGTNNSNNNIYHKPSDGGSVLLDRTGQEIKSYRDSLPPFVAAAAAGNLELLQEMVQNSSDTTTVTDLLNSRDRHLSTADHWAAGNGHVDCLRFLMQQRNKTQRGKARDDDDNNNNSDNKKVRRRDGKTCLHYAARYGRIECLQFLLDNKIDDDDDDDDDHNNQFGDHSSAANSTNVDETSGDGTTPFQLACFGVHIQTAKLLVEKYGANPRHCNDWGCNAAHWIGMAKTTNKDNGGKKEEKNSWGRIRELCQYLKHECGVDFCLRQKQGHTILHKAAQYQNYTVIQWLMNNQEAGFSTEEMRLLGQPDAGGHKPSDILRSVDGDAAFAQRLHDEYDW